MLRRSTPQESGIILGKCHQHSAPFGFHPSPTPPPEHEFIIDNRDGHLLTVAPTGAGKGVSAIVPTLLTYPGQVIVFDPKGENYQITAKQRERMGHQVIVINPFDTLTEKTDALNPLDLLRLAGADIESEAQMLAQMLSAENRGIKDPFWDLNACGILSGLIAYYGSVFDDKKRTMNQIHQQMHQDDVDYQLADMLDKFGKEMNQFAHREIAAFLQHPERETRGGVRSTAVSYLKCLAGGNVPQVLDHSTFSLQDFVDGKPISIYLIIPPNKLDSHRGLLRLMVGTLLAAVMTREVRPAIPTLYLLDEAAQLGRFPLLEQAITLCRGYGLKVWSFWQDLSQLKGNYPNTWNTMMNNCNYKQLFGVNSIQMARDWKNLIQLPLGQLMSLPPEQQVLIMPDGSEIVAEKLNYLKDKSFTDLYKPNPRFNDQGRKRKRPQPPKPPESKPEEDQKNEDDGDKSPRI